MKLYFYDNYQEEGCTFCGDDGERHGLVATYEVPDFILMSIDPTITARELYTIILQFKQPHRDELIKLIRQYPKARIDIV